MISGPDKYISLFVSYLTGPDKFGQQCLFQINETEELAFSVRFYLFVGLLELDDHVGAALGATHICRALFSARLRGLFLELFEMKLPL